MTRENMPLVIRSSLTANTFVNSVGDGSITNPAYTFYADPTVGVYRAQSNTVGFASQGANAMSLTSNGTLSVGNVSVGPSSAPATIGLGPWTAQNTAASNIWLGALWVEELGLFVAVSKDGTGNRVQTSPDGFLWTSRASAADNEWWDLAWSPSLRLLVAVGAVTATAAGAIMTSPDAITWTARTSPSSPVLGWSGVAWSPTLGRFVAVGYLSLYSISSTDGVTWTAAAAPEKAQAIVWAPALGLFVAVASSQAGGTTNAVLTSSNGTTWTYLNTGAGAGQRSIAWSDELQLLAAFSNPIYGNDPTNYLVTSPNATTWTSRRAFPSPEPSSSNNVELTGKVIAVPGLGFIAVQTTIAGYGYKSMVLISRDGITWTTETYSASTIQGISGATSVVYSPSLKRLVIFAGSRTAYTMDFYVPLTALETPAMTHLARSAALALHSPTINQMSLCNDKIHVTPTQCSVFSPSQNTLGTWRATLSSTNVNYPWNDICISTYTGQAYAVESSAGTVKFIYSSMLDTLPVGDNWRSGAPPGTIQARGVTVIMGTSGECVIIVGVGGGMYTSGSASPTINLFNNPRNMSPQIPSATWESVAASSSVIVAVASTSTAGGKRVATAPAVFGGTFTQTWTERTSVLNTWKRVIWCQELGLFVACSNSGTLNRVMTSSDNGVTWISRTTPIDSDWRGIAWSPELSLFVIVGLGAWALTSPDGVTWTARAVPTGSWKSVAWGASARTFVAVSSDAGSMYSVDGLNWTRFGMLADCTWSCIAWSGHDSRFIAVADGGGAKRVMLLDTVLKRGNVSVSGQITSIGQPWTRGKFAAATAPSYIPLTSTQGTIAVTNSTQLFAPIAGLYMVGFQEIMNSSSVLNTVIIKVNTVDLVATLSEDTTTGFHYRNAATVVYLYAGDYVQFWVNSGSVYSASGPAGEWANYFLMRL